MPLIELIFILALIGGALYVVNALIPMPGNFKALLNFLVILMVLVWVFQLLGIWHYLGLAKVPVVR